MKRVSSFFLFSILVLACGCHGGRSPDMGLRAGTKVSWDTVFKICDREGFSVPDYSFSEILGPLWVRHVGGRLISRNWNGRWQEGVRPLFEIRAVGKGTKIYRIQADEQGRFFIRGLRDGQYCFMVSCWGWDSYLGTVIVDKHADPKNEIFIEMGLASPR
jgi:hypothetical protein